jgi:sRNA-binding carbon storage regulator CsrA
VRRSLSTRTSMVVAITGERVRLGITAPRETVEDRQETHERRHMPALKVAK